MTGGDAVVVAPDEEPSLPPGGNTAQGTLAAIVLEHKAPVLEVPHQRGLVAQGVAERLLQQTAGPLDLLVLELRPGEERLDVRPGVLLAEFADLVGPDFDSRSPDLGTRIE